MRSPEQSSPKDGAWKGRRRAPLGRTGSAASPEPITPEPRTAIRRPLLTQVWADLAFIHWAVDPAKVAGFMPPGVVPDTYDGVTYVGIVAFRVGGTGFPPPVNLPYLGAYPETNVRLYSVDERGRRGVVFCSLDASRLVPVAIGRLGVRLPYVWSRMAMRAADGQVRYASAGRGPRRAYSRIAVRPGAYIRKPTGLEHFLTARWAIHIRVLGRTLYLPNDHPRWPLHRAELLECDENLIAAAGVPVPDSDPVSVLYSPGVPVRFGVPRR